MRNSSVQLLALCVAVFALAGTVAWGVFEAMPHLEDEQANLFQARVFAAGRITADVPRHPNSFLIPFVVTSVQGKRFGKYPPGYPLLLSLGAAVGQPWLTNALTAALGILGVYLLGRELFGQDSGLLAAALGAISPMFVLLSGTLLSHPASIAALTLFAWAFLRARRPDETRRTRFALLAGGLLGWAVIIRPWTALGIAFPFALFAAWDIVRTRGRALPFYGAMALACALVCAIQPLFNLAATGSATTNTYRMWWDYDRVGFGPGHGRSQGGHTVEKGIRNMWLDLADFPAVLFGWPQPAGIALAWLPIGLGLLWPAPGSRAPSGAVREGRGPFARAWCFLARLYGDTRKEWGLLTPAASLVAAQIAYWARADTLYGPRYYAEAMPFLWIIAARGLLKLGSTAWRRRAIKLALPLLVAWSVIFTIEPRALKGRGFFDISRRDADAIAAAAPHHALVFVAAPYWTAYANLAWLNSPNLDGDVVFAQDRGKVENARVIEDFAGRTVYYYDRARQPALRRALTGGQGPAGP
jgi:4-amino-4-deoxy-L-arabinose transferase-like glycosyltransferase